LVKFLNSYKNYFFIRILISLSFISWFSHGSKISFTHASLFCKDWCLLSFLIHQRIYHNPTKSCKRLNNGLGCSSLIILVTLDAVANLAHSSGVALLHILVNDSILILWDNNPYKPSSVVNSPMVLIWL